MRPYFLPCLQTDFILRKYFGILEVKLKGICGMFEWMIMKMRLIISFEGHIKESRFPVKAERVVDGGPLGAPVKGPQSS